MVDPLSMPSSCIAAAAVTVLYDEPGGNVWLSALSTSGLITPSPSFSCSSRLPPFSPCCGATSFGSNDGHDAATFSAPVRTSITTAPPRRPGDVLPRSSWYAVRCASGSIVSSRFAPSAGLPMNVSNQRCCVMRVSLPLSSEL